MKCQCEQLMAALRKGPMTTGLIRHQLGIGMPGTRVYELRDAGYDIRTDMVDVVNRFGQKTRAARYTLVESVAMKAAA